MTSSYSSDLSNAFLNLTSLREQANRLNTQYLNNEEKLLKAGGEKASDLKSQIELLTGNIATANSQLEIIESKDETNEELTEDNNLTKARLAFNDYEKKIASATRTNDALHKKNVVEKLIVDIKEKATKDLKASIISKTNEKLKKVITDDLIEVENIDRYIKLKGKNGASEGQTLSIAYCFLGTLFEDAELAFPFIIDSPAGKMDFDKRRAVAEIVPLLFNQMIAFVTSAEVEQFADKFYDNFESQFITIIASPSNDEVEKHEGIEFFDSYQRSHQEEE